jgi:large conductance mechanosensitive channel
MANGRTMPRVGSIVSIRFSSRSIGVPSSRVTFIMAIVRRAMYSSLPNLSQAADQSTEDQMLKEFKEFAMRGNVVDIAVGLVIGAAFGAIVTSFVGDLMMPAIGVLTGGTDFSNFFVVLKPGTTPGPYASVAAVKAAGGVAVAYGLFVNAIVNFVIVAFALFMLVKGMNALKREQAKAPAPSPEPTNEEKLLTEIRDLLATR